MGGTNTSLTSTPNIQNQPTTGNIGAGAALDNAQVMPIDLAGGSNNTLTITDVSPGVYAAAAALATKVIESQELVTSGALNLATSTASRSADLAQGSTGSGPYQGLIASFGKYALGGLAILVLGVALVLGFRRKKKKEHHSNG